MFTCPRHAGSLTLSEATCATLYARGKTAAPWDTTRVCKGCEIGAAHAGESVIVSPPETACLRCGRTGLRLIGKRLCVSCYNRERELTTGKYRRLAPPQNVTLQSIVVTLATAVPTTLNVRVSAPVEAMSWAARAHPGVGILSAGAVARPWGAPAPSLQFIRWRAECQRIQLSLLPGL